MELAHFILQNTEQILHAWETFARNIHSARDMTVLELRDHSRGMLSTIVGDLTNPAISDDKTDKSGKPLPRSARDTYAALHGEDRELAGFSISETISEFRALQASILGMWDDANKTIPLSKDQLTLFNETIDQALSESLEQYSTDLKRYARLFRTVLSSTPDLNCMFDADGRIIYANSTFAEFYNLTTKDIIGKNLHEFDAFNADVVQEKLQQVIATMLTFRGEIPFTSPWENEIIYEYFFIPVLDEKEAVESILLTARDISESKKLTEKISTSANYDSLTGLTNRSLFRDRMDWEVQRSERSGLPIALFFIDLDGFKEVNDLLGHDAGDLLLQQAAERIGSCVRGTDTVARIGGDEFTVILSEGKSPSRVDIIAQQMVDELSRPFQINDRDINISGSIGITIYPQDAMTTESLMRNADQAMYGAKKAGGGGFCFFDTRMRDSASTRLKEIEMLRHALRENQFVAYYQPIVNLSTEQIVKAEALVRWHHPQRGLVMPDEFIGLAEEIGLISEIDDWMFGEAVLCSKKFSALIDAPFQISVNKSALDFTNKVPTKNLAIYLASFKLDKGTICVEITESVLLNDSSIVIDKLAELQKAGIQLAIDDFGTGYASMSFLNKFKVDYLKIDRSFVQDMAANKDSRIFAETIIVMAHKLGLKVIAEGVETVGQRDLLKAAGCDYAQGYFFSRPVPLENFERLLQIIKT
ncbi:putative bifunctional diguanylate cyclase/phosphodiesterase [Actimicrobium antarcticum]|uniref:GGDEF domain-containing protein n=1 Tax=Actimicrobium antarcticum TaxID=1051899 RepID=A0ABP7SIF7_9BURK